MEKNLLKSKKNHNIIPYIAAITILVSIAISMEKTGWLINQLVLSPAQVIFNNRWWQILSHAVVIPQPISLLFQMLFIWYIGRSLEQAWGSIHLLSFYLFATIFSGFACVIMAALVPSTMHIFIYGPGAALIALMWEYAKKNPQATFFIMFIIPVKAKYFILIYVGIRLLTGDSNSINQLLLELIGAGGAILFHYFFFNISNKKEVIKKEMKIKKETDKLEDLKKKNMKSGALLLSKSNSTKQTKLEETIKKEKFDFNICPPEEFEHDNKDCLACEAYNHCLVTTTKNNSTQDKKRDL